MTDPFSEAPSRSTLDCPRSIERRRVGSVERTSGVEQLREAVVVDDSGIEIDRRGQFCQSDSRRVHVVLGASHEVIHIDDH